MKLSRRPININERVWYYEEKSGLTFIVRGRDETIQFVVPTRLLRTSLNHYMKAARGGEK